MRNESALKSKLMSQLRLDLPHYVALRHEDVRSAGHPDLSLTGEGRTTWWECKHYVGRFDSTGIQELTMLRLSVQGFARYIVWQDRRGILRTLIVHPKQLRDLLPEAFCSGFDMHWLCSEIRKAHGI